MELSDIVNILPHGAIVKIAALTKSKVSRQTVSNYLNNMDTYHVAPETRIEILDALAEYWEKNKKEIQEREERKEKSLSKLAKLINQSAPHCE